MIINNENNLIASVQYGLCRISTCFFNVHLYILSFVVSSSWVLAQKDGKDSLGVIIKWTPSSLFTPETPTMRFGLEVLLPQFSKRGLSIQFDYGFRYRISANPHPYDNASISHQLDPFNYVNKRYSKYHLELRKYLDPTNIMGSGSPYLAIEGFYIPYTYEINDWIYKAKDGMEYVFDNAHVSREINGGDIKAGYVVRFNFPLYIEGFVGLGVRFVNREYYEFTNRGLLNPPYRKLPRGYDMYNEYIPQEGKKTLLHVALGIRIGYRIF